MWKSKPLGTRCALVLALVTLCGCDPRVVSTQRIALRVAHVDSAEPVESAAVLCAPERRRGSLRIYGLSQREYLHERGEHGPPTTRSGQTAIIISDIGTVLTDMRGEYYLFSIDAGRFEILSVLLQEGESAESCAYRLRIESVSEPVEAD